MSIRIDTPFATVEDTARALGVPRSRMLKLIRLLREKRSGKSASRSRKHVAYMASTPSRKRRARAKTSTR